LQADPEQPRYIFFHQMAPAPTCEPWPAHSAPPSHPTQPPHTPAEPPQRPFEALTCTAGGAAGASGGGGGLRGFPRGSTPVHNSSTLAPSPRLPWGQLLPLSAMLPLLLLHGAQGAQSLRPVRDGGWAAASCSRRSPRRAWCGCRCGGWRGNEREGRHACGASVCRPALGWVLRGGGQHADACTAPHS